MQWFSRSSLSLNCARVVSPVNAWAATVAFLFVCLLCLLVCWFGFMLVLLLCLFVSLLLYLFVGGVWFGPVDSRCSLGVVGVGMAPFIPHCAVHPSRVNYGTWRSRVCYHLHSYQSTPSLFLLFLFFPPKELLLLHHTVIHSWFQILGYGMICLQFTSNPFWVNWNQPGQSLKSKWFFFHLSKPPRPFVTGSIRSLVPQKC